MFHGEFRVSFWESKPGAVVGVLAIAGLLGLVIAGIRVQRTTHPPRKVGEELDFEAISMRVEQVRFPSLDGIALAGWLLEGVSDRPTLILCHDLGASKASLVSLAVDLNGRGFSVLLVDFRAHGESGGSGSTLGIEEKRDILGALDYLAGRRGREAPRVGIYAIGMGAHAAVLAAADRPALRALVLDGLYPDASLPLRRQVFAGWEPGMRHFSFLSDGLFALMSGSRVGEHRAADVLPQLVGRDVLLMAAENDPLLTTEMQRMVATLPPQSDTDGSLVLLPESRGGPLYGDDLGRRRETVARFFESRLLDPDQGGSALARRP